ncbi:MAG: carboxypeptidase-like regulatory domain-containing protein [Candidatus Thiodiazotropha sp. (ex Myrtea sp. 'scaly one' KF741663)]|nr:carboxypeptidase-like regulatory domain-containing protein [Candidatus Thiodiazotropha sp. (ex Myrtea sp. 'scaly one' KF741663)]
MGLITGCVGMNVNTLKPMPRGVVVDEETGKPISGAYVLVRYIGDSGVVLSPDPGSLPSDECYGSLVVKTDEAGRFDFSSQGRKKPVSLKLPRNQRMEITAYKPGYTMETTEGRITRRYEVVGIGSTRLEMTPQEKSKFETRNGYLSDLTYDSTCDGGYGIDNWKMERAVLEEVEQSAKSLGEWSYTRSLCKLINMRNEYQNLGHTVLDCSVYAKKIKKFEDENAERFNEYVEKLKQLVKNITWDDSTRLELMEYKPISTKQTTIAFYMSNLSKKSLDTKDFRKLMERVCQVGLPLETSFICFTGKNDPSIWHERTSERCYAQYRPILRNILIQKGDYAGTENRLEEGWCKK